MEMDKELEVLLKMDTDLATMAAQVLAALTVVDRTPP